MNTDKLTQDAIKLLCTLIEIPSISREEKDAVDTLERILSEESSASEKLGVKLCKNHTTIVAIRIIDKIRENLCFLHIIVSHSLFLN